MAGLRVHFVFPAGLVERVDAALTVGQSRGEFVRAAVEQALGEAKEPLSREQADPGSVSSLEGVRSAAPAEQPEHATPDEWDANSGLMAEQPDTRARVMARSASATYGTRSSVQAKRDVRPVPKAKP